MGYQRAADRVRVRELQDGFRARVDALLTPPAAESIADLQQHFAEDRHLTPAEFADYRHRLAEYGRSCPVDELPFPPLGAA
jgi:hypothetical protein